MGLTDEQQKIRAQGVCGSEIGAVAGLSPYSSPLQVANAKLFYRKTGKALERVVSPQEEANMRRGRFFEAPIAQIWQEETGATKVREPGTLVHLGHPIVIATPDREAFVGGERLALEVKAPGRFAKGWGDPGTDDIPRYILAQAHWEMAVLDVGRCDVAAWIDDDLAIYPVTFDPEFFGILLEVAQRFWTDFILKDVLPPAGHQDTDALKALHPSSTRPKLQLSDLPPEAAQLVDTLRTVRAQFKAAEEQHDALINRLKQVMGAAEGLETPYGRIDWKQSKNGVAVNWQNAFAEMQQTVNLFCGSRPELLPLREALAEIQKAQTKEKPGARPFVVRFKEAA